MLLHAQFQAALRVLPCPSGINVQIANCQLSAEGWGISKRTHVCANERPLHGFGLSLMQFPDSWVAVLQHRTCSCKVMVCNHKGLLCLAPQP